MSPGPDSLNILGQCSIWEAQECDNSATRRENLHPRFAGHWARMTAAKTDVSTVNDILGPGPAQSAARLGPIPHVSPRRAASSAQPKSQ